MMNKPGIYGSVEDVREYLKWIDKVGGMASDKTMLDDFAGKALINYSTKRNRQSIKKDLEEKGIECTPSDIDELIAKACYLMADAMIEQKRKREKS